MIRPQMEVLHNDLQRKATATWDIRCESISRGMIILPAAMFALCDDRVEMFVQVPEVPNSSVYHKALTLKSVKSVV